MGGAASPPHGKPATLNLNQKSKAQTMSALAKIHDVNEMQLGDALAAQAANVIGVMPGTPLKFNKSVWFLNDIPINNPDDEYRAEISAIVRRWEKWSDKELVDTIAAGVRETLPQRFKLGDFDKTQWELGLDGQLRDPWCQTHYLLLTRLRDDEKITFRTSSHGGRKAIWTLAAADRHKVNAGLLPIVTLGCGSYLHKQYGPTPTPSFKIVRWMRDEDGDTQKIENGPQLIEAPREPEPAFAGVDPDDRIPF